MKGHHKEPEKCKKKRKVYSFDLNEKFANENYLYRNQFFDFCKRG